MSQRIEVCTIAEDGRAHTHEQALSRMGKAVSVRVVDVYTIEQDIKDPANLEAVTKALANPVTQTTNAASSDYDFAIEIGYLPGVTDNIGHTAEELLHLILNETQPVYSSQLILLSGKLSEQDAKDFAATLYNPLIQRARIQKGGAPFPVTVPKVVLDNRDTTISTVDLDVSDENLMRIGKEGIENPDGTRRGPLGLSLPYMKAIQEHFRKTGRSPTDAELETLAQTWSEHCKHTIFAAPIDDIKDGIYRHYIKRATQGIRHERGKDDICVSVFKDNSGAIVFDENWLITDKVETHNSPSALDPFGGAITGIVGVNRDCIGFGQGAKPVLNRYGFCLADPYSKPEYYRGKGKTNRMLAPETILKGVVHGVNVGGNCSGIPTPQGFLYFDDRFAGKPLVFAGTIGLIPRFINNLPAHEKSARPGDRIIMAGGKVGRDGIHGATFSSSALDEGSPATAVQIGDPITQKKLSDAIVKEIRDLGLYNAITDNGAGGLSSSIGEMGEDSGGFHVELDKVPLKYPGMQPWEIWISESQERMTLAVPQENVKTLLDMLEKRGVEAWDIGEFTDSGRAMATWHGEPVLDIDMDFLHNGLPETPLTTTFARGGEAEPDFSEPEDYSETLLRMLGRLNICSKEFVAVQYDHSVQGSAVLGPLQGPGRVCADASVSRPVLASPRGVVLSQGLAPRYSDIDTGAMAAAALDTAVRHAIAAGGNIHHLALLDNFCWCSSEDPERLGQLKRAAEAIYELAVLYKTPFISGKDSMFNDFSGFDSADNPVKISIPPTLLVSGIGVIEHVDRSVSLDPKQPGDLVYLLGRTRNELGGSEYYAMHGVLGNNVPETDGAANLKLYKAVSEANARCLCASALAISFGGLAVALAKKSIASKLGMDITIDTPLRSDHALFSETQGRILVTVAPENRKEFESLMQGVEIQNIGIVTEEPFLSLNGVKTDITSMDRAYKEPLKDF